LNLQLNLQLYRRALVGYAVRTGREAVAGLAAAKSGVKRAVASSTVATASSAEETVAELSVGFAAETRNASAGFASAGPTASASSAVTTDAANRAADAVPN